MATGADTVSGAAASATIGPAGGTLATSDGRLTISVPAGAVGTNTTFTITPITKPANNALSTFKLEPEGLTFPSDKPVTITFSAPEAGESFTAIDGLGIAYHDAQGHWKWLSGVTRDQTSKTLSVDVTHFSVYGNFAGYMLQPGSADVEVNGTVPFQVMYCQSTSTDPALAPLVFECHLAQSSEAVISNWSVNGAAGGNATYGTVAVDSGPFATFTAPSQKPDPATVQVTVEVDDVLSSLTRPPGKVMLFSLITIGQTLAYSGSFDVTAYGPMIWSNWTAHGTATWTPAENGEYAVSASITADQTEFILGDDICVLNGATRTYENLGQIKELPAPPTIYWLLDVKWSATCTNTNTGAVTYPSSFLSILWSSGCANGATVDWAELDSDLYPDQLVGSYTWPSASCTTIYPGMPTATVNWNFAKQN